MAAQTAIGGLRRFPALRPSMASPTPCAPTDGRGYALRLRRWLPPRLALLPLLPPRGRSPASLRALSPAPLPPVPCLYRTASFAMPLMKATSSTSLSSLADMVPHMVPTVETLVWMVPTQMPMPMMPMMPSVLKIVDIMIISCLLVLLYQFLKKVSRVFSLACYIWGEFAGWLGFWGCF